MCIRDRQNSEKALSAVNFCLTEDALVLYYNCLLYTSNTSGEDMTYYDQAKNEKYVPYCIEPSVGADRVTLAFLCDAYNEEEVGEGDVSTVLKFHPALAPIKAAVLPLSKKLNEQAAEVYAALAKEFNCDYDDAGSIGKRYRRQDEVGTPFCKMCIRDSAAGLLSIFLRYAARKADGLHHMPRPCS